MSFRSILVAFWFALALTPVAWCQSNIQLFPIAEIKPGLKGVGRTIFQGDQIEEFQVEILGILKNVLAPKHDLILARLSGGPLEKTGVIAGMSGSPVYIDGKLSTTLRGDAIVAEFKQILDHYVESHYGQTAKSGELVGAR